MKDLQFERVSKCPLCGSSRHHLWTTSAAKIPAFQCVACELIYMGRRLTLPSVSVYYDDYNHARDTRKSVLAAKRKAMYELDRRYIQRFIRSGSILDMGAGPGTFISGLPRSFHKFAFDVDQSALTHGRLKYPSIRFLDTLDEIGTHQKFDALLFRGTLQYQRNLKSISSFCLKHLAKNGYLFILATPNADAPLAVIARERWTLFNAIEHLYHFNLKSLQTLFRAFCIHDFDFTYIGTPYENWRQDLKKFIALAQNRSNDARFPFWGSMMNVTLQIRPSPH